MSNQPFKAFIKLIEYDQSIRQLHADLQELQAQHNLHEADLQQLTVNHEQRRQELKNAKKAIDDAELHLKALDTVREQKKKLLEQTSESREYQALKKELDQITQEVLVQEEIVIQRINHYETVNRELKTYEAEYQEARTAIEGRLQQTRESIARVETELHEKEAERPTLETVVPQEWLVKYNTMRLSTADPVVPLIQGSCCSACFFTPLESDLVRLSRRALVQCRSCFRLLYSPDAFRAELGES